jgi:hypothetical protein
MVVAIILRLFAIYWLVSGLVSLLTALGSLAGFGHLGWMSFGLVLLMPVAYLLLSLVTWIFAGRIAEKVTGASDPALPVAAISRGDLYGFGLLVTGLWYFLSHLGSALVGLHQLALHRGIDPMLLDGAGSPVHAALRSLVPCLAGMTVALCSPALGRKIVAKAPPDKPALP